MLDVSINMRRGGFTLDIAFEQQSRITGVFGPSGAGKSTLIEAIAGLATPDSGRIELNDRTLFDSDRRINLPPHKRRVGVMFQDDRLFPHMDVRANLTYGFKPSRESNRRRTQPLEQWEFVELLGIGSLLDRRVATLSGGERQRVSLGRAMLAEPDLLLLDEPLSSLDARLKQQILPYLRRVRDVTGIPMLFVSHDLTELLQLSDHLLLMNTGRAQGHGRFHDLVHDHAGLAALHDSTIVNVWPVNVDSADRGDGGGRRVKTQHGVSLCVRSDVSDSSGDVYDDGVGVGVAIIRAADVALALNQVREVSIQNQVAGTVRRITNQGDGALVEIDVGQPLLAELTQRAVTNLHLQPGTPVWCLIKSNAIRFERA